MIEVNTNPIHCPDCGAELVVSGPAMRMDAAVMQCRKCISYFTVDLRTTSHKKAEAKVYKPGPRGYLIK